MRRPRPLVASLYAPRLVRRRLESAWPEIVTGASVIILGLHGGSAIAALLLDGFAGRVLPVGLPSAMLLPALLALLVGGMRLIEMGAPAWRAEWRALSLAATAAGYILALT